MKCKAVTRSGKPCSATIIGLDGYCSAHSGNQDMREIGRKGGSRSPGQGGGRRSDGSIRDYLREKLNPADLVRALQSGLDSDDEREQMQAAKIVLGELYEGPKQPEQEKAAPKIDRGVPIGEFLAVMDQAGVLTEEMTKLGWRRDPGFVAAEAPEALAEPPVEPEPDFRQSEPVGESLRSRTRRMLVAEAASRALFRMPVLANHQGLIPPDASEEKLLELIGSTRVFDVGAW